MQKRGYPGATKSGATSLNQWYLEPCCQVGSLLVQLFPPYADKHTEIGGVVPCYQLHQMNSLTGLEPAPPASPLRYGFRR